MQAATALYSVKATAITTAQPSHKGISRKRSMEGSSEPLAAAKKVALVQAEDEEMLDVPPIPTAMEADWPCTRAATRRKNEEKGRRQRRAWC